MYAILFLPQSCKGCISAKSVKQPEKKYRELAHTMEKQSLHTVADREFGRGSPYAWPGDIHEARRFLARCGDLKSSANYLECDFYNVAGVKDVKKRFKDVVEWPLPYLVVSAAYCFLLWRNRTAEKICNVGRIDAFDWKNLCRVFLIFGEPLFEMIKRNGWARSNKESIRDGFTAALMHLIHLNDPNLKAIGVKWVDEGGRSWFDIGFHSPGKCYPENLLGCLELASVNETVARLAIREVFETETLYPLHNALLSATDIGFAASPSAIDEKQGGAKL